ncbi:MAG: DUF3108 domain-containing protein [Tannerella sp.]|jgi:hypothetical protein|nr:DUF3108 domain-containing protein [Tannerella sp.]
MSQRKSAITGRKDNNSPPVQAIRSAELAFKKLIRAIVLCCLFYPAAATAQAYRPEIMSLNDGEETTYEVYFKWGILMPRAGEAKLSFAATSDHAGAARYRMHFATTRFFDAIYKMRDTLDCYYAPDFSLLYAVKHSDEGGYSLTDELTFSYSGNRTVVRSHRYTPATTKIDTSLLSISGHVFDMFGVVFYLRTLDWNKLKTGDRVTCKVAIGRDLVHIACRYSGRTIIAREQRKYRTHRFTVEIYDKAFEQTHAATEIWISDDENHMPVKIRSKLKIGAAEIYCKSATNLKAPLKCVTDFNPAAVQK